MPSALLSGPHSAVEPGGHVPATTGVRCPLAVVLPSGLVQLKMRTRPPSAPKNVKVPSMQLSRPVVIDSATSIPTEDVKSGTVRLKVSLPSQPRVGYVLVPMTDPISPPVSVMAIGQSLTGLVW